MTSGLWSFNKKCDNTIIPMEEVLKSIPTAAFEFNSFDMAIVDNEQYQAQESAIDYYPHSVDFKLTDDIKYEKMEEGCPMGITHVCNSLPEPTSLPPLSDPQKDKVQFDIYNTDKYVEVTGKKGSEFVASPFEVYEDLPTVLSPVNEEVENSEWVREVIKRHDSGYSTAIPLVSKDPTVNLLEGVTQISPSQDTPADHTSLLRSSLWAEMYATIDKPLPYVGTLLSDGATNGQTQNVSMRDRHKNELGKENRIVRDDRGKKTKVLSGVVKYPPKAPVLKEEINIVNKTQNIRPNMKVDDGEEEKKSDNKTKSVKVSIYQPPISCSETIAESNEKRHLMKHIDPSHFPVEESPSIEVPFVSSHNNSDKCLITEKTCQKSSQSSVGVTRQYHRQRAMDRSISDVVQQIHHIQQLAQRSSLIVSSLTNRCKNKRTPSITPVIDQQAVTCRYKKDEGNIKITSSSTQRTASTTFSSKRTVIASNNAMESSHTNNRSMSTQPVPAYVERLYTKKGPVTWHQKEAIGEHEETTVAAESTHEAYKLYTSSLRGTISTSKTLYTKSDFILRPSKQREIARIERRDKMIKTRAAEEKAEIFRRHHYLSMGFKALVKHRNSNYDILEKIDTFSRLCFFRRIFNNWQRVAQRRIYLRHVSDVLVSVKWANLRPFFICWLLYYNRRKAHRNIARRKYMRYLLYRMLQKASDIQIIRQLTQVRLHNENDLKSHNFYKMRLLSKCMLRMKKKQEYRAEERERARYRALLTSNIPMF